ncbi:uncharacterized protein LOC125821647 [Solanum verrucosum]|uniref:uncharacterized protein LOC125821647 n=1 Tax=Solanum verrucosum TaxID=315347 RepID=UPI0020D0C663|nr:uncharacterized protein LOC125821647 [Solanum verrucosum]
MAEYEACILGLKMAIDMNVHELLVIGDSDLLIHQVQGEWAVKNPKITPYVQYIQNLCKRFRKIEFRHTPRTQNELADALATIASMIKHLDTSYIDPVDIEVKEQPVHCSHVEPEPYGLPCCKASGTDTCQSLWYSYEWAHFGKKDPPSRLLLDDYGT